MIFISFWKKVESWKKGHILTYKSSLLEEMLRRATKRTKKKGLMTFLIFSDSLFDWHFFWQINLRYSKSLFIRKLYIMIRSYGWIFKRFFCVPSYKTHEAKKPFQKEHTKEITILLQSFLEHKRLRYIVLRNNHKKFQKVKFKYSNNFQVFFSKSKIIQ